MMLPLFWRRSRPWRSIRSAIAACTSLVQDSFLRAYGVNPQEQQLLTVLKLRVLLQMFAQGRAVKESALRKKVMWANVMKRFIETAAERSMAPAA